MILNKISRLLRVFVNIIKFSTRERPIAVMGSILRRSFGLLINRYAAILVGFSKSYLGANSKVIGTRSIFVGEKATIKQNAWIEAIFSYGNQVFSPSIKIGHDFFASDRLHISSINLIEIGDNCLFGSGVYIGDHNHGVYKGEGQSEPFIPPIERKLVSLGPVSIGSNVWFGDNVVVIGPVRIGNGVVVGANSVVTRDVPDYVMVAGAPLRIIKRFDEKSGRWEKNED